MCDFVIKSDGRKEAFDLKKVEKAITAAGIECALTEREVLRAIKSASEAVSEVLKGVKEIHSKDLRDNIVRHLEKNCPDIAICWVSYEKENKKGKSK